MYLLPVGTEMNFRTEHTKKYSGNDQMRYITMLADAGKASEVDDLKVQQGKERKLVCILEFYCVKIGEKITIKCPCITINSPV